MVLDEDSSEENDRHSSDLIRYYSVPERHPIGRETADTEELDESSMIIDYFPSILP